MSLFSRPENPWELRAIEFSVVPRELGFSVTTFKSINNAKRKVTLTLPNIKSSQALDRVYLPHGIAHSTFLA